MAKNPVFHSHTCHIAIKYHFIRDAIEEGEVQLKFCRSDEQIADIFTKALPKEKFEHFRELLGVMEQHIRGEQCSYNVPVLFCFEIITYAYLIIVMFWVGFC